MFTVMGATILGILIILVVPVVTATLGATQEIFRKK